MATSASPYAPRSWSPRSAGRRCWAEVGARMAEPEVVIDRAALDALLETTGGDSAFLADLIDTYLGDSVGLLAAMRQAIAIANAEELRRAAHSLKSNSASFGARTLASLCQELEQRARTGVLEGAPGRLADIEMAYAAVEDALRTLRPGGLLGP